MSEESGVKLIIRVAKGEEGDVKRAVVEVARRVASTLLTLEEGRLPYGVASRYVEVLARAASVAAEVLARRTRIYGELVEALRELLMGLALVDLEAGCIYALTRRGVECLDVERYLELRVVGEAEALLIAKPPAGGASGGGAAESEVPEGR